MEPLKLPSEAEIRIPARQSEDAVVVLVFAVFGKLARRAIRAARSNSNRK